MTKQPTSRKRATKRPKPRTLEELTTKQPATRQLPHRQLSSKSNLENLKTEAKRWLRALTSDDPSAREPARQRLSRAYADAPAEPKLRFVQHALALEHGFASWRALKNQLEGHAAEENSHSKLVDLFLEYACADPILCNGPAAHARRERAALRILTRYPEIAYANIHTAVVCGDLESVERILRERPEAATEQGGPQRRRQLSEREQLWTPLLHLCYGRLPTAAASDNAVAVARLLLDHGADPNDYFEVGDGPHRYTALCGVAGEGEDDGPPHPRKEALARLLLERGAEPYDIQLLYNTHFHGDILWFLELMYEFSVKTGRRLDWDNPDWPMVDMGGYDFGARYLLLNAINKNNLKLAEWCLTHGANPNAAQKPNSRFPKRNLHEAALRQGFTEMADLLVSYGATPSPTVVIEGIEAFASACFRLDRGEARRQLAEHPEYLQSTVPIFAAARRDRADVVEFLLDLGVSIEIEDAQKNRSLHVAAGNDSLAVAKLLIQRGAEIDPVETNWNNTPLDYAMYHDLPRMIEFLSRFSRDVFVLTFAGAVDRLGELISEKPELSQASKGGNTLMMWLPEDERRATKIVELLVANGADTTIRNEQGMTPADYAERRGLYNVAALLRAVERTQS